MAKAASLQVGVARAGPRPLVVSPGRCPLRLSFWLHESSGKIEFLQYFPGFFLKVGFLHKNETLEQFC
jgi:hypothetical protein